MRIRGKLTRSILWSFPALGIASVAACAHDQARPSTAATASSAATDRKHGAECPALSAAQAPPSDAEIAAVVMRQLRDDPGVAAANILVTTTDGVVQLTGSVSDLLSKERAWRVVETVRGVRAVSDRLQVHTPQREDEEIESDVRNALVLNAATESYEVHPTSREGVVTLTGTVQSRQEKELAERTAKTIRGVREVIDKIDVDYGATRTDAEIKSDIEARLRWDALVERSLLRVSVDRGEVRLTGHVGSAAERSRAYANAWVNGVIGVDTSGVQVDPWAKDPDLVANRYPYRSDAEIASAIKDAARYDPRIGSSDIEPSVESGYVTLQGTVPSLQARHALTSLARHTVGVMRVRNFVQVRPDEPVPDDVAEGRVEAALRINPVTAPAQVKIDVVNGKAVLNGTAENYFVAAEAGDVAAQVQGIKEVENRLRVKNPTIYAYGSYLEPYGPSFVSWTYVTRAEDPRSDEELACEIERELAGSAVVNPRDVNVDVANGTATLTGTVDTWTERSAASEEALAAGATVVRNRLQVE